MKICVDNLRNADNDLLNQKAGIVESKNTILTRVRASFILKGTSFNAWCIENKIVRRTAEQALIGENQSENALRLAAYIISEANLIEGEVG